MAQKGNEQAPEATKKAKKKGEGHEGGEAESPASGPMGGDESPGHAPMGEATKNTTPRPGPKSET